MMPKENSRKVIIVSGFIAAIPDMDMFLAMNLSEYEELIFHRSFSHAILPFIVLSALLSWFSGKLKFFKEYPIKWQFAVIFTVLFTHSLLDCLTTWGTQLFWPFGLRIATQTEYVIDIFYSGILFLGVVPVFIFQKKDSVQLFLKGALSLSIVYLVTLFVYQQIFIQSLYERPEYSNALRITTQPSIDYPYKYRSVIETENQFFISVKSFSLFEERVPSNFIINKNLHLEKEIEEYFDLTDLKALSRKYLAYEKVSNNVYHINDLRYGPRKLNLDKYESVFSYYIIINDGEVEFKQNMRTGDRIEKILRSIFR